LSLERLYDSDVRPITEWAKERRRSRSKSFRVHRPDRSVPTPVTDSGDDPPISGHDNGFAKLHAHDGVAGASKDAATTVVTIGGARCSW
jgi:hypothetical protein